MAVPVSVPRSHGWLLTGLGAGLGVEGCMERRQVGRPGEGPSRALSNVSSGTTHRTPVTFSYNDLYFYSGDHEKSNNFPKCAH